MEGVGDFENSNIYAIELVSCREKPWTNTREKLSEI